MSQKWRYRAQDGTLPPARVETTGKTDDGVEWVGRLFDEDPGGDWVDSPAKVAAAKPEPKTRKTKKTDETEPVKDEDGDRH